MPTWYCDNCGKGINVTRLENDEVEIEFSGKNTHKIFVLLRMTNRASPAYFVVESIVFAAEGETPSIDMEHIEYYHEQHSCPTNFVKCEVIIDDGDEDPHGIFKVMDAAFVPPDWDFGEQHFFDEWRALFPILGEADVTH